MSVPGTALRTEDFADGAPFATFARLRRDDPVSVGELPDGSPAWNIVRFDDVANALLDTATFLTPEHGVAGPMDRRAASGVQVPMIASGWKLKAMSALNGAEHTEHRKRFVATMRPRRVECFRATVSELASYCAQEVRTMGEFDAVHDFAAVLAGRIACAYLGINLQFVPDVVRLSAVFMADALPPPTHSLPGGGGATPPPDLISQSPGRSAMNLVHAAWGSGQLPWLDPVFERTADRWEREDLALQRLTAGVAGLRNGIVCMVEQMALSPARYKEVRSGAGDGIQLALVANEVLRVASPLWRSKKIVSRDIDVHGRRLQAGDTVLLWLVSANRDPSEFSDPDEFRPFRKPNRHVSFSYGAHRCIGGGLSVLELVECLRAVCESWRTIRLVGEPTRHPSSIVNEYVSLPIRVQ